MLRAAIAGVGFMGWIHYLAYQRSQLAMLDAFCSRNPAKRSGDWTSIQGNFGPPGEKIPLAGIKVYESLDEILTDPDIDLVDICLPPNLHVEAACNALEAGKHVLCEKPLGLNTSDCDQILSAARKADRRVMVAQVLPYMGEFQFAYQAALKGDFGKPIRANFKRVISPPDWIPDFYDANQVGGPLIDLHVHDTHFVRLLFGMPKQVMCIGERKDGIVKFCHSLMQFDDPNVTVSTQSGVSNQTGRPFCHGFEIQFEKALLCFELSAQTTGTDTLSLKIFDLDGNTIEPELPEADEVAGFTGEIDDCVRAIESGEPAARLEGNVARDAIHICQCLQESCDKNEWVACS